MLRKVNEPLSALENTLEMLLLGYRYDAAEASLELITGYPKEPGADRTFLRVRFGKVSEFKRIPGTWVKTRRFKESYTARADRAAFVVQSVRVDQRIRPMHIHLGFGDFGGIEFSFGTVSAHSRNTLATKRTHENEWDYRDADNDTPLDFYEPFDDPFE